MIRTIVGSRLYLTLILTLGIGVTLNQRIPFPEDNAVLQLILAEKPIVFLAIKYAYQTMLFSTPFIGCSMLFSLLYIFLVRPREIEALSPLPPYPLITGRDRLFLIIGELHYSKRPDLGATAVAHNSRPRTRNLPLGYTLDHPR
jgi:hypothetical protein